MLPGHRAGLHPHQGGAHRRRPRPHRLRRLRLGKPAGGGLLDLPHGGRVDRIADRLCQSERRREEPLRRGARRPEGHGLLRHDARLPAPERGGRAAGPLPHLAQHHHRPGGRGSDRALFLQHSPALVHRSPLSGHAQRGGACEGHRLSHHPGRLRPLQAHRPEGAGGGRGQRHVPHRQQDPGLRPGHGGLL